MPTAVVHGDAEARREKRHHERPLHVVHPGAVREDEGIAGAELLEKDADAVDGLDWHSLIIRLHHGCLRRGETFLNRRFELVRFEAPWAEPAPIDDASVRADQIEPVGQSAVLHVHFVAHVVYQRWYREIE